MELDIVKNYLRIDFDDDNELLEELIDYAAEFIKQRTGRTFDASNNIYKLLSLKIISLNYKQRDSIIDKKSFMIPRYIDSDLFLLKYSGGNNGVK